MNRRGFLKSVASLAGAKAMAPVAALVIEEAAPKVIQYTYGIDKAATGEGFTVFFLKSRQIGLSYYSWQLAFKENEKFFAEVLDMNRKIA